MSRLTIKGLVEEMPVHSAIGHTQVVGGLQGVVAIVVVGWVFKGEAALDIVLVNIHMRSHIISVGDFLNEEGEKSFHLFI